VRNFAKELVSHFELQQLRKSTLLLIAIFITLVSSFVLLFVFSVGGKLGDNVSYSLVTTSETYTYKPNNQIAPSFLLKRYKTANNCQIFSSEWRVEESALKFAPNSTVIITRFGQSNIRIDVQGENFEKSGGELDEETLGVCTSFLIELVDEQSVVTMNLYGDIEIGRNVSDASDAYFPIMLQGKIIIQDNALITDAIFYHTPIELRRGDYIRLDDQNIPPRGILRASKNTEGLESVIMAEGGQVISQSYRSQPKSIDISFINRLSDDNELAIALSSLFILIQFVGLVISFLLRMKVINNTSDL